MTGYAAAFDWARTRVDDGRLPTAVLGIATADGVVALDAFGRANGRPAKTGDHFRLFSITKPLVGIAAARAIERGCFTPETPLTSALPEFGAGRDDIVRLKHLVSHTAGISEPPLDPAPPLRNHLLSAGRDFVAGSASRYSTIAYEGIAAMIEKATDAPWDAAVSAWAREIGADGLTLDESADPHEVLDAGAAGVDIATFVAGRNPGAGLLGRAEDLLAVGSALLRIGRGETGGILHPSTLAMMLRPLTGDIPRLEPYVAERGQDWGFTWNLRTRAPGLIDHDVYGHGGWAGTEFWVHPTAGLAWVLMTNRAQRDIDADQLSNAVVSGV